MADVIKLRRHYPGLDPLSLTVWQFIQHLVNIPEVVADSPFSGVHIITTGPKKNEPA